MLISVTTSLYFVIMSDYSDIAAKGKSSGVLSSAIQFGSGLVGGIASAIGARKQRKWSEKMWQKENERQDWLMLNSELMKKKALKNAGYSIADPNGTGVQLAAVNQMNPVDYVSAYNQIGKTTVDTAMAAAQVANLNAQTRKLNEETTGQEIQNYLNNKYGEQQWQSAISKMDAETRQSISDSLYKDQQTLNSIKLTDAQTRNIEERLDMDWQKLTPEIQLLAAQAEQASATADLSREQKKLVWNTIRETSAKIALMQSEIGLNGAQVGVAVQLAKNYSQDFKIKGNQIVTTANEAEMKQFEQQLQESMGLTFYQAEKVANFVLPFGAVSAALGKVFGK